MQKFEIKLGGSTWPIESPLRFKRLRVIEPMIGKIIRLKMGGEENSEKFYEEISNLIVLVIGYSDPTFTLANFDEIPVSIDDLTMAMRTIAQAAGMWKEKSKTEAESDTPPNAPSP